ncbi:MAG: outer membrane beta-barrel protein [Pseudomonadota bacterium]
MPNTNSVLVKSLLAFCSLIVLATDVRAEMENPTGFVVAGTIGRSRIQDQDAPDDTFDGRDFGFNLDLEWRFIENFALGMNIASFGEDSDFFNGEDTTIRVYGFGFYARGYLPINERWTLHGTLGRFAYETESNGLSTSVILPFTGDANTFGAGVDYALNKNWAIRFDQRWFDGADQEEGTLTTIGFRWQY